MSPLPNARHERVAQGLAKGNSADQAYAEAGYKPDRGNAARLTAKDSIRTRVEELLERSAAKVELTVASATETLLRLAQKGELLADAAGLAVAKGAIMDACKLNGLVIDKSQVATENVTRILSDKPQTEEEWAQAHGADLGAAAGTIQ